MPENPPARRGPGRPRKVQAADSPPPPDGPVKTLVGTPDPEEDPRIGQKVADDRWTHITFPDGSEYAIRDGAIWKRIN